MGESQVFGGLLQNKAPLALSSSLGSRRAKQPHLVAKVIFDADNPTILCCYCLFSLEIDILGKAREEEKDILQKRSPLGLLINLT